MTKQYKNTKHMTFRTAILLPMLAFFVCCPLTSQAQKGQKASPKNTVPCLTVEDLENMLHLTYDEIVELLDTKDFIEGLGGDEPSHFDTIEGVALAYAIRTFNARESRYSGLQVFFSKNGLSNQIHLVLKPVNNCSLYNDFTNHEYTRIDDNLGSNESYLRGNKMWDTLLVRYEVYYYEDEEEMRIRIHDARAVEEYVEKEIARRKARVNSAIRMSATLAGENRYIAAQALLDSMMGVYTPLDDALMEQKRAVLHHYENYFKTKLKEAVNIKMDANLGIAYCDSILTLTPNDDSIKNVRALLMAQSDKNYQPYSRFDQETYDTIVSQLERLINKDILENPSEDLQRLTLDFSIHTAVTNESHGTLKLSSETFNKNLQGTFASRNAYLQSQVDIIAANPNILPVNRYGLNIVTDEQITADIKWKYHRDRANGKERATRGVVIPTIAFVDTINNRYFTKYDTVLTRTGEAEVKTVLRKPTKTRYVFGITDKTCNGTKYTDVSLVEFKTTSAASWMPSLIIPGLGTYLQERRSSVASRAIPFFAFSAIAVAGFLWESTGGKDIERPKFGDVNTIRFWEYQNFGYYIGAGAAAIAGTIYLTDLIQAISTSVSNRKRSKQLRKELMKQPIELQMQNVQLRK